MAKAWTTIACDVAALAVALPSETLETVAQTLAEPDLHDIQAAHVRIAQAISQPYHRSLATAFLDRCLQVAPHVPLQALSLAIQSAARAAHANIDESSVELVWTGPESQTAAFRRTEQAILQILSSARRRIVLVSYAVYRIPHVSQALVAAAQRGITIDIIVETPHLVEGRSEYDTLRALGQSLADCAVVYYWPKEERKRSGGGRLGSLHVKCVTADGAWLFLSSANLTEYAFTVNMELGVLVRGGSWPRQVEEHFDGLIGAGSLVRV